MSLEEQEHFINNIRIKLEQERIEEYNLIGFEIIVEDKPKVFKEGLDYETKKLKTKLVNYVYEKSKKEDEIQLGAAAEEQSKINQIDIVNGENIFNVIKDKNTYVEWKKLENDVKKEKIIYYLNTHDIELEKELLDIIFDNVDTNKINYKKYIEYDKINERIIKMPLLVYNKELQKYSITLNEKEGKKIKKTKQFFNK